MTRIVLTVIGDDRAGLVEALSEVISEHAGNWERSQMTELAGKFAGIVVVSVPDDRAERLRASLDSLDGLLDVSVHPVSDAGSPTVDAPVFVIDLLGTDRPGIVREVSGVLHRHHLSIESIETQTRDAPMAGGRLFEAHVVVRLPQQADPAAVQADLEQLAAELLVDIAVAHD
ncbi:MAG TPA: ACT domain-containing protein [Actinomycetota bacterium]|nr:ACT domain-containing protein [Actinomycetota bacterium]